MPVLIIKFGKERIHIHRNDILYVAAHNKHSIIYLKDSKKIESTDSLKLISTQLEEPRFYRTHGSFVINCSCIKSFNTHHVTLNGDIKVSISRNKRKSFETNLSIYNNKIKEESITPK